jgi:cytochrome c oxidase subunit 4
MAIEHDHSEQHNHPSPRKYVVIGVILAIITAIEVGVFYIPLDPAVMTMVLLTLSGAKFLMVVGFFMHLKFDDPRFAALFFVPMFIMVSISIVLLALFLNLTR